MIEIHHMEDAFVMIYFYDQVLIGKYDNYCMTMKEDYDETLINEIHIFDKEKEIRWKRTTGDINWQNEYDHFIIIRDTEDFVEESMFLIGNKSIKDGLFTVVTQYGRKMILPFECYIENGHHRWALIVHHLFFSDGSIGGYRLVDIKEVKKDV